jgi:hypothetical protein
MENEFSVDDIFKSIKSFKTQKNSLLDILRKGRKKGSRTYVRDIDEVEENGFKTKMWSWRESEMTIWTGYQGEGKSQFLIFLCLMKAIKDGWKFAFFSPENDPPDEFFDDLIHTILGKTTDRNSKDFNVTEDEYLGAMRLVENNFFFVYPESNGKPDYNIKNIEKIFEYLIQENDVKAVIVDPYIKIKHQYEAGEHEHQYAARFMMERVFFARKNNVSYHLVMHQTTPSKSDNGNYTEVDEYKIKGGGTFADSADNVMTVQRPNKKTNPQDTLVVIKSVKIKKQKLVGMPSKIEVYFDRKKNRYISSNGYDYIDGSTIESKQEVYNPYNFPKNNIPF